MIARCEKERRDGGVQTDMMEYRYTQDLAFHALTVESLSASHNLFMM